MVAKSILHKFVSAIPNDANTGLVRTLANWNDDHDMWMAKRTITTGTDTMLVDDNLGLVQYNNAGGVSVTLPIFTSGWVTFVRNLGAGNVTIDPSGANTINEAA